MKVLILNGSPRKNGNTAKAMETIAQALIANHHEVELRHLIDGKLKGCVNCDGCKLNGGNCVLPDGGAELMNQVAAADLVIFGSPVYWWGVSSQLKAALDKFYSKDEAFHKMKKKIGIVTVGAAGLEDPEYQLISRQFQCIAEFLGWDLVLDEAVSAWQIGDLERNVVELESLAEKAMNL